MNTRAAAGPFAPPTVRHGNDMLDEGIVGVEVDARHIQR
jgi:hypothetical protein